MSLLSWSDCGHERLVVSRGSNYSGLNSWSFAFEIVSNFVWNEHRIKPLKRIGDSHTRKKLHLALHVSHLLSESWGYGVYASSCAAIIEFLSLIHSTILYLTQNQSYSSRATNHQVPVPIVLGSLGREKWTHFKTCVQHRVNDFLLAQRLEIWPFRGSCLLRKHVLDLFHIFHYIYIHHIIFMLHPTRSPSKCFAFYPIFRLIWCQNHLKPIVICFFLLYNTITTLFCWYILPHNMLLLFISCVRRTTLAKVGRLHRRWGGPEAVGGRGQGAIFSTSTIRPTPKGRRGWVVFFPESELLLSSWRYNG